MGKYKTLMLRCLEEDKTPREIEAETMPVTSQTPATTLKAAIMAARVKQGGVVK
jgi:hypothetical protein